MFCFEKNLTNKRRSGCAFLLECREYNRGPNHMVSADKSDIEIRKYPWNADFLGNGQWSCYLFHVVIQNRCERVD